MIKHTTTKTTNFILSILFIGLILSSCQTNDIIPESAQTSFEVPDFLSVGEEFELLAQIDGSYDALEWTLSDGTFSTESKLSHTFEKSGSYSIQLKTFSNGIETSSTNKSIDVFNSHKFLSSELPVYAKDVFYVENKIIISAVKQVSDSKTHEIKYKSTFFLLDDKLNLISEIASPEEISDNLNSFLSLGDSILAFNNSYAGGLSYYNYKSAGTSDGMTAQTNSLVNYNNGFVYLRNEGNSGFYIDFFNESLEKLWTKSYDEKNTNNSRYLFNLNNRLYYLSFDKNSDKAYIKKFKNQSVAFQNNEFSLNTSASNREELFAFNNPISNNITFAIYCKESLKTSIYTVNEDCSFELTRFIDGRFDASPKFCTSNGSVVTTNNTRIVKYNSNWDVVAEKELTHSNFSINQLGDNLYLLCENLPSGIISVSFIDKHLKPILFE
jgi:hypothetical protein